MACNFNFLTETEGLFKVRGSQSRTGKSGNSSEMVQGRDITTTDH